jgi:hypothetical protein
MNRYGRAVHVVEGDRRQTVSLYLRDRRRWVHFVYARRRIFVPQSILLYRVKKDGVAKRVLRPKDHAAAQVWQVPPFLDVVISGTFAARPVDDPL